MSVDIVGNNGEVMDVPNISWRFILELGRISGWMPGKTKEPDGYVETEAWDGSYEPAMGQHIASSDAVLLATAIRNALNSQNCVDTLKEAAENLTREHAAKGYSNVPAVTVTEKTIFMLQRFVTLATSSDGFEIS